MPIEDVYIEYANPSLVIPILRIMKTFMLTNGLIVAKYNRTPWRLLVSQSLLTTPMNADELGDTTELSRAAGYPNVPDRTFVSSASKNLASGVLNPIRGISRMRSGRKLADVASVPLTPAIKVGVPPIFHARAKTQASPTVSGPLDQRNRLSILTGHMR